MFASGRRGLGATESSVFRSGTFLWQAFAFRGIGKIRIGIFPVTATDTDVFLSCLFLFTFGNFFRSRRLLFVASGRNGLVSFLWRREIRLSGRICVHHVKADT